MIYLDKAWEDMFKVIDKQKRKCRALYEEFIYRSREQELSELVLLTPMLAELTKAQQVELKELLKQEKFLESITWV